MKIQYMETATLDRREKRESCKLQEDGQMLRNYRVPVSQMLKGYRVPGLVKLEIVLRREGSTAQLETDGLKSTSDKYTV